MLTDVTCLQLGYPLFYKYGLDKANKSKANERMRI